MDDQRKLANQEHLDLLKQGVDIWNQWRKEHQDIKPNLKCANLDGIDLSHAHLEEADLRGTLLRGANLSGAYFQGANLDGALLTGANLSDADLIDTILAGANFSKANLTNAWLTHADMSSTNLTGADLSASNLSGADLTGSFIYAISAWDINLTDTIQSDLIITPPHDPWQPRITLDNLEMAQFIYLLLNNQKIRSVIDTITSKVVLILARFIIVDLTDPSSAPHEVAAVIPHTVVPVQPLLLQEPLMIDGKIVERREYAMFEDLRRRHHWVLPTFRYQDTAELLASLQAQIIAPAEQKARELNPPK